MTLKPRQPKTANLVASTAATSTSTRVLHSPSSEPFAFSDANRYAVWHNAMCDEIAALCTNRTWSLVPFHPSMNVVGNRWVYQIKRRVDGSIERFIAALLLEVLPIRKVLIILKPSVQLLSRPLFDWFSLSRFREIGRFISLIFIMPSSMVFLLKRST
jgi:hypothetical protein